MGNTIDFSKMRDVADRGIRRAAAFVGLGVNASRDCQFKKYQLSEYASFRVLPDNLSNKSIAHIKEEFEKWVIVNGIRELVESFGLFLDNVHASCLALSINKKLMSIADAKRVGADFERKGVEDKLNKLNKRFAIKSKNAKYFSSMNQARNCITHRKGIVGPEDLKGEKCFKLIWWGFDIYAQTKNGERHSLLPPFPEGGIFLPEGGSIMIGIKDRIIEYKLGDSISLTPNELSEISLLVKLTTDDIVKSAYDYAKRIGVKIVMSESFEANNTNSNTVTD